MSAAAEGLRLPLKLLSTLLDYPGVEQQTRALEIGEVLCARPELAVEDRCALSEFLEWLGGEDSLEAQAAYVNTFDRGKQVSLYLFEHVYGESRHRGPAMIELAEAYREHGLVMQARELPDYLPLFLEFCAEIPEAKARAWLQEVGAVLQRVHVRLAERRSHYAAVFRTLLRLAGLDPSPQQLIREVQEERRDDTRAALDNAWREVPVILGPDQAMTDCGVTPRETFEQPLQRLDPPARAGAVNFNGRNRS